MFDALCFSACAFSQVAISRTYTNFLAASGPGMLLNDWSWHIKYESSNMILSLGKPAQHKALFITFQLFSLPWVTVVYYTIKSCTFRAFQIKPYCTRFLSKSFLFHEGRNLRLQSSLWKREKESGGRDPDPDKKLGTHLYLYLSMQPQPWKWI